MRLKLGGSLTLRLTLLFAFVSTAVLLLLGILIGRSVERHFQELDMGMLQGKLQLVQHALTKIHTPAELERLPQRLDDSLIGHHGLALTVIDAEGRILFATHDSRFPDNLLAKSGQNPADTPLRWESGTDRPLRGISARVQTGVDALPPVLVAVATDISHHEYFMHSFRVALWTFVILASIVTGLLGWIVVHRGLSPLQAIRQEAEQITAGRLDARIPIESVPSELEELARTLNAMLARLQDSFQRLSDFSSDLAHELRTPVSNLLTQTQVVLSKRRDVEAYQDVLASNAEEFERLSRIISDMLFLAKADNNLLTPSKDDVELSAEVNSLFEFYEALAEEKGLILTCHGQGNVAGDQLMLRRAINNLLSNAIRHSPQGGAIDVDIAAGDGGGTTLSVTNSGETIPPEHLPRLFDRFYRTDSSRQRFSDGAGLGLAITRSILRAHRGEVAATSASGLTRFTLRFPATTAG